MYGGIQMQILILGNGFDKASGLPTLYKEFFTWRTMQIEGDLKLLYDKCEKFFLAIPSMDSLPKYSQYGKSLYEYTSRDGLNSKTYRQFILEVKNEMLEWENINFFDLFFYIGEKNKVEINNWCDVENRLKYVLDSIESKGNATSEMLKDSIGAMCRDDAVSLNKIKSKIGVLFQILFFDILVNENQEYSIYEILKSELLAFEKVFQKYIGQIYRTMLKDEKYRNVYTTNYLKLVRESEEDIYLLNFNYTCLSPILMQSQINITEANVHGRYDHNIIFGIEQSICDREEIYMFSKTYRKIESYGNHYSLPKKGNLFNEVQTIIFYGHSLSEADYSYFQSIFDVYDIYNQTTIIFKYSVYDKNNARKIKNDVFQSVTALLKKYGETMSNKDHGKNLIHKLLLEGRLILEQVELKDMKFQYKTDK